MPSVQLPDLISAVDKGEYQIPSFQRDLVWRANQMEDLLVSLLQNYFVGALLLWELGSGPPPLHMKPVYGVKPGGTVRYAILDGQQRITTVYYAFTHPPLGLPTGRGRYSRDPYHFFLDLDALLLKHGEDEWVKAAPVGSRLHGKLVDDWFKGKVLPFGPISPSSLPPHLTTIPPHLTTIADLMRTFMFSGRSVHSPFATKIHSFLTGTSSPLVGHGLSLPALAAALSAILSDLFNYRFEQVTLPPGTLLDNIANIFVKINSTGTRLTIFDLAVAKLSPVVHPSGMSLRTLWEGIHSTWFSKGGKWESFKEIVLPDYVLRVMSLITGGGVRGGPMLNHLHSIASSLASGRSVTTCGGKKCSTFKDLWDVAVDALEKALDRISREYGAFAGKWVPYPSMLVPLAALLHLHGHPSYSTPHNLDKIDCWYWHSVFYERYDRSVDSTTESDFKQVEAWMKSGSRPSWVSGSFPPGLNLRDVTSNQSAVYRGVMNLLYLKGARDFISGLPLSPIMDIEDDHLFPKAKGYPWHGKREVESILNKTLITQVTNRKKGKRKPSDFYGSDVVPGHTPPSSVADTFLSHLINRVYGGSIVRNGESAFASDDFVTFLEEREESVKAAIEEKLKKCP